VQLDDINIFDYKAPTPEEILAAGPGATATPINPYERFQQERSQLSLDPVKRTLQRAGQGLGSLFAVDTPLDYALSGLAAAKPVVAAGKGIAALTRPVFPAPQRMFDPANKGYNPSLSDFGYEPGGRYLQMGKDKTDITGQIPQAGRISVGPDGKPSFMVSADLAESLPNTGKIIRTNLFKKKAGWKWTKTPEGFDPNPASDFPIVSVETGNKHYYTLATDFPDGVELSRYAKKTSEPRLRPTTKGEINLGQKVGEISVRGKKHPVYDQITAGKIEPKDMVFLHNTSEEAIKSFDAMGGIPSPSIAVTKADQPFIGYGKIQLIGRPEKFDPLIDPRNKIYSSDAYTPRAPKKIRLARDNADKTFEKDYKNFIEKISSKYGKSETDQTALGRDVINPYNKTLENLRNSVALQKKGSNFNIANRNDEFDRFFDTDLAKTKFYQEIGRDPADLKDKPFPQIKYNKWVNEQKDKYLDQKGVFTYFDEFDETTRTMPYTLDNVVENMVQERQRGGEGDLGFFGDNRLMALTSESFKDLPGVKAQKDRLVEKAIGSTGAVEDDIMQSIIKNLPDEDLVKAQQMNYPNIEDVRRIAENEASYIATQLTEAIGQNLEYGMDLPKAIKTAYTEKEDLLELPKMMPGALFDDIEQALIKNATRPVEYFEAKPTRAVGFDEFAGAIVPENTSKEVIDILEKRGLKVVKQKADDVYDYGKGKIRQQFGEQFFSMAPIAAGASATAMMEEEDRGIGSL